MRGKVDRLASRVVLVEVAKHRRGRAGTSLTSAPDDKARDGVRLVARGESDRGNQDLFGLTPDDHVDLRRLGQDVLSAMAGIETAVDVGHRGKGCAGGGGDLRAGRMRRGRAGPAELQKVGRLRASRSGSRPVPSD
jgi:hypothetical protein